MTETITSNELKELLSSNLQSLVLIILQLIHCLQMNLLMGY